MLLLPDELVHIVVGYLAYHLEPQCSEPPELQLKRVSTSILSLSLVNCRLRRICLPFLILHIKSCQHAKGLREQCSLRLPLFGCVKMLILNGCVNWCLDLEEVLMILYEALPYMRCLSYVNITGFHFISITLLTTLHEHPSVSTILVSSFHDLPEESIALDLSKVVLEGGTLYSPNPNRNASLLRWLERGIKVSQLILGEPELLTDEFGSRVFSGLSELVLQMSLRPVVVSWLPELSSANPYLKKIRFIDDWNTYPTGRHTLPFISSFVQEARNKQLCDTYFIGRLVISRPPLSPDSNVLSQKWLVTGMVISIRSSLTQILSLLQSSFPEIQALGIDFRGELVYHIDDVIEMLCLFSSLETLALYSPSKRLHFGQKKPWCGNLQTFDGATPAADIVEAGILWYTHRIAQCVPSLQAFNIYEEAEPFSGESHWCLRGWLSVLNAPDSGRDVVGKLR